MAVTLRHLSAEHNQVLMGVKVGDFIHFESQAIYSSAGWDNEADQEPEDGDGEFAALGLEHGSEGSEEESGDSDGGDSGDASDSADEDGNEPDTIMRSTPASEAGDQDILSQAQSPDPNHDGTPTHLPSTEESHIAPQADQTFLPSDYVFYVKELVEGSTGAVVDLALLQCDFATNPTTPSTSGRFTTYDDEMVYLAPATATAAEEENADEDDAHASEHPSVMLQDLAQDYDLSTYVISLNPSASFMRSKTGHGHGQCWANCNEGWLHCLDCLFLVLPSDIYSTAALQPHRPVCPACMGLDLLREQQALRVQLEAFLTVDFGATVEFLGRFNIHGQSIGYDFWQYDEREWGYHFDDMLEDDNAGSEGDNGNDGYEHFPEAFDPAANVVKRPADKETIAALPRFTYEECGGSVELGEECLICRDKLEDSSVVVLLPCIHVMHECVTRWLEEFDTCPTCRAVVGMNDSEGAQEDESGSDSKSKAADDSTTGTGSLGSAEGAQAESVADAQGESNGDTGYEAVQEETGDEAGADVDVSQVDDAW
ncbi:hypothetical protein LTR78_008185 [Recurvomyces mirabilis]|uniref:RING-type domain-containing protein n=1 Tax=Recurvomyces mirabilis TaxID=574656 RepID=A0AAE0TU39_9PEZI|nr:hypothetical protein LTR78_008185 [Recurvomyces mirabilis]KAK5150616.1 hypothetical protein LTS14_009899 [Recurvomyces mirabilis]